jgi:DNA-binding Xre family transcriptional regulator
MATMSLICGHPRYVAGCGCCRAQSAAYERRRRAAVTAGTWQPTVPAGIVRAHVTRLRQTGMSLVAIANHTGVARRTISDINRGVRRTVHGPTAAAILRAVPTAPPPIPQANWTPAVGAGRRVRALVTAGWPMLEQARRTGLSRSQVWELAWDKQTWITTTTAATICGLFDRLELAPGPSTRARNQGRRHGWPPPLAWDHDTIDDPHTTPDLDPDGDCVDEVAISRVLAGKAPAMGLSPACQAVAYHRLSVDQRLSDGQIRYRLGLSAWQVQRLHHAWQHHQQQQFAAAS